MKVIKIYSFDASHILPRHTGKCGRLHGHTYHVQVGLENPIQKDSQFVIDYGEMDIYLVPLINKFDHNHLNLFIAYPSAENIATYIAGYITFDLGLSFDNLTVGVSETPKTLATWDSSNSKDVIRLHDSEELEFRPPKNIIQVQLDIENYFRRCQNAVIS